MNTVHYLFSRFQLFNLGKNMQTYCIVFLFLKNVHFMFSMTASSKSNSVERVINQILGNNTAIGRHPTTNQETLSCKSKQVKWDLSHTETDDCDLFFEQTKTKNSLVSCIVFIFSSFSTEFIYMLHVTYLLINFGLCSFISWTCFVNKKHSSPGFSVQRN